MPLKSSDPQEEICVDGALGKLGTQHIETDETEPDARLVRAQLLLHRQDFAAARKDLEACLKKTPGRDEAVILLGIVREAKPNHLATPLAGMSLTQIILPPAPLQIEVLRDMKPLTHINNLPPTQFWKLWDAAKTKSK